MIHYFDAASTTKPVDTILEAIKPYIETEYFNPSSLYSGSTNIKKKIDLIRTQIARQINAEPDEIYFTSGASESNSWVIHSFNDFDTCFIASAIEHNSIMSALDEDKYKGFLQSIPKFIPVDENGFIDKDKLTRILKDKSDIYSRMLITVNFANNEIGTIEPIKEISDIVHQYNGAIFHTDATQAFGHIQIDVKKMGIDLMSASAQKIGGLKGCGFLYIRNGIEMTPLIFGSQEKERRGSTENVIGIVAFGKAIESIDFGKQALTAYYRDKLIAMLKEKFNVKVNGALSDNRLPNNINVTFPQNITGEALIYMLDSAGYYISAGSACNSYKNKPSYVLQAIGLSDDEISRTIRITLPDNVGEKDIENLVNEIDTQIKILTTV